jgi:hypothetical protein
MNKFNKKVLFALFLVLFIFLLGESFTFAQRDLEVDYPEVSGIEPKTTEIPLPDYIKYIFNFSLLIAGLVAFGASVLGGVKYLTSAGNPAAMGGAKNQVLAGILGLVILLSSYIILTNINPQLVIVSLGPLKEMVPPEIAPPPEPPELATLVAAEIPLGHLIDGKDGDSEVCPYHIYEGVIAKDRLNRIKKLSDDILKTSGEIVELSKKLQSLLEQCNCEICETKCSGGCSLQCAKNQEGKIECQCVGNCSCNCLGDPCRPNREAIKDIQDLLGKKAAKLQELNSALELEIEDLKETLEQLKRAEETMKECPDLVLKEVKVLGSMSDFWIITSILREGGYFKELKNGRPWLPIMEESDPASFYCTELPILPPEEADEEELQKQIEESTESETNCEIEIQIGYVTEEAKKSTQKLIEKMELLSALVSSQITATHILIPLPDQCTCPGGGRHGICPCSCGCGEGCSACVIQKECYCTEIDEECWCIVCPCEKVKAIVNKIECIHNEISSVHGEIDVILTRENNLRDADMAEVRMELRECVNEEEAWADFLLGVGMLQNDIFSCEEAKSLKLIDSCQHEDNYFCCKTEIN